MPLPSRKGPLGLVTSVHSALPSYTVLAALARDLILRTRRAPSREMAVSTVLPVAAGPLAAPWEQTVLSPCPGPQGPFKVGFDREAQCSYFIYLLHLLILRKL